MESEASPAPSGLILAVDDNQMNLDLVDGILTDAGFEVITAEDGSEALEVVVQRPPDCIVLDIMMPRIDGFEVCSKQAPTEHPFHSNRHADCPDCGQRQGQKPRAGGR
jgi:CheY-like chemotaxis protein